MEPTKAPWATAQNAAPSPISKGETTFAPWARETMPPPRSATFTPSSSHPSTIEATIPRAEPRLPQPTIDSQSHAFIPAEKRITTPAQLKEFLSSPAATDFLSFILHLNASVKGRSNAEPTAVTPVITSLCDMIARLSQWVEEIPPLQQSLRYGNPAFRTWHGQLVDNASSLLQTALPQQFHAAIPELVPYLLDSFGNATRIDYGTGHETNFIAFLYCLAKIGFITSKDCLALVTRTFRDYLTLMRKIQTTYWLEPAGSHGAWGLDDYQFLPFLWGSAQLLDHPFIRPNSIIHPEAIQGESSSYLYLEAVAFVQRVKKGPLQETSPMLCDISAVPTWTKVNKGMVKMYQAEVLSKFPIMQHFLFGSLLDFTPSSSDPATNE